MGQSSASWPMGPMTSPITRRLRNWTLKITVIDLAYGAVVVAGVAVLTTLILQWLGRTPG